MGTDKKRLRGNVAVFQKKAEAGDEDSKIVLKKMRTIEDMKELL